MRHQESAVRLRLFLWLSRREWRRCATVRLVMNDCPASEGEWCSSQSVLIPLYVSGCGKSLWTLLLANLRAARCSRGSCKTHQERSERSTDSRAECTFPSFTQTYWRLKVSGTRRKDITRINACVIDSDIIKLLHSKVQAVLIWVNMNSCFLKVSYDVFQIIYRNWPVKFVLKFVFFNTGVKYEPNIFLTGLWEFDKHLKNKRIDDIRVIRFCWHIMKTCTSFTVKHRSLINHWQKERDCVLRE